MPRTSQDSVTIRHCFGHMLAGEAVAHFPTVIEVLREESGQLAVYASYCVPGNSGSMNEIDVRTIEISDVLEIMRIAVKRMIEHLQESVIFEIRGTNKIVFV